MENRLTTGDARQGQRGWLALVLGAEGREGSMGGTPDALARLRSAVQDMRQRLGAEATTSMLDVPEDIWRRLLRSEPLESTELRSVRAGVRRYRQMTSEVSEAGTVAGDADQASARAAVYRRYEADLAALHQLLDQVDGSVDSLRLVAWGYLMGLGWASDQARFAAARAVSEVADVP